MPKFAKITQNWRLNYDGRRRVVIRRHRDERCYGVNRVSLLPSYTNGRFINLEPGEEVACQEVKGDVKICRLQPPYSAASCSQFI